MKKKLEKSPRSFLSYLFILLSKKSMTDNNKEEGGRYSNNKTNIKERHEMRAGSSEIKSRVSSSTRIKTKSERERKRETTRTSLKKVVGVTTGKNRRRQYEKENLDQKQEEKKKMRENKLIHRRERVRF